MRPRGESHYRAKLTHEDVDLIMALYSDGVSTRKLAEKFEVSQSTIAKVVSGRSWQLQGYVS